MKLVDPDAPFFKPLWVRVLCVVMPLLWAGLEMWMNNPFWAILFAAAGLYLAYELFLHRKDS